MGSSFPCVKVLCFLAYGYSNANAFIAEITRVNYERELARRALHSQPVRVFLTRQFPLTQTVNHTEFGADGNNGPDSIRNTHCFCVLS